MSALEDRDPVAFETAARDIFEATRGIGLAEGENFREEPGAVVSPQSTRCVRKARLEFTKALLITPAPRPCEPPEKAPWRSPRARARSGGA